MINFFFNSSLLLLRLKLLLGSCFSVKLQTTPEVTDLAQVLEVYLVASRECIIIKCLTNELTVERWALDPD